MTDQPISLELELDPFDNARLANLCGRLDEHLRLVERRLGIEINNRGGRFQLISKSRGQGRIKCELAAAEIRPQIHSTPAPAL